MGGMDAFVYNVMKYCGLLNVYGVEVDPMVILSGCIRNNAYQLALMYLEYLVSGNRIILSPLELIPPSAAARIEEVCLVTPKSMLVNGLDIEPTTNRRSVIVEEPQDKRRYTILEPDSFAVVVTYREPSGRPVTRALIFRKTPAGNTITLADDTTTEIMKTICTKELNDTDLLYTKDDINKLKEISYISKEELYHDEGDNTDRT